MTRVATDRVIAACCTVPLTLQRRNAEHPFPA
jgi:hypothetical protein